MFIFKFYKTISFASVDSKTKYFKTSKFRKSQHKIHIKGFSLLLHTNLKDVIYLLIRPFTQKFIRYTNCVRYFLQYVRIFRQENKRARFKR